MTYRVLDYSAPDRAADPIIDKISTTLVETVKAVTPVKTGRLATGWYKVKEANSRYRVANAVPYARFVEYGTRRTPARSMLGRTMAGAKAKYE